MLISHRREFRHRVRQNLQAALQDIGFLLENLPDRDMQQVFADPDDGTQLDEEKRQQLLQMIAFVRRAADIVEGEFTPVIEDGLREAYEQQRPDHLDGLAFIFKLLSMQIDSLQNRATETVYGSNC